MLRDTPRLLAILRVEGMGSSRAKLAVEDGRHQRFANLRLQARMIVAAYMDQPVAQGLTSGPIIEPKIPATTRNLVN